MILTGILISAVPGLVFGPILMILGFGKQGTVAGKCTPVAMTVLHMCHKFLNYTLLSSNTLTNYIFYIRIYGGQNPIYHADCGRTKRLRYFPECGNGRIWSGYSCQLNEGCRLVDCSPWDCSCHFVHVEALIIMTALTGFLRA